MGHGKNVHFSTETLKDKAMVTISY